MVILLDIDIIIHYDTAVTVKAKEINAVILAHFDALQFEGITISGSIACLVCFITFMDCCGTIDITFLTVIEELTLEFKYNY